MTNKIIVMKGIWGICTFVLLLAACEDQTTPGNIQRHSNDSDTSRSSPSLKSDSAPEQPVGVTNGPIPNKDTSAAQNR